MNHDFNIWDSSVRFIKVIQPVDAIRSSDNVVRCNVG